MYKKKILITGGAGQLGQCIEKLSENLKSKFEFCFVDYQDLDLTDESKVEDFFDDFKPNFCINAAAYTAVDLAEDEVEKAYAVNSDAVEFLAKNCKKHRCVFIHISTDYVFDGDTQLPYDEENFTNPIGIYGKSKLQGEEKALEENPKSIIIRTSWLYSEFGKNFVKTMLNLFQQKDQISVVSDQYGQPTYAMDLAETILNILQKPELTFGVFHFSNYSEITWFDFAKKIAELSGAKTQITPISTQEYPTKATRPKRSTFNLEKIEKIYQISPKHWEHRLEVCLKNLNQNEG